MPASIHDEVCLHYMFSHQESCLGLVPPHLSRDMDVVLTACVQADAGFENLSSTALRLATFGALQYARGEWKSAIAYLAGSWQYWEHTLDVCYVGSMRRITKRLVLSAMDLADDRAWVRDFVATKGSWLFCQESGGGLGDGDAYDFAEDSGADPVYVAHVRLLETLTPRAPHVVDRSLRPECALPAPPPFFPQLSLNMTRYGVLPVDDTFVDMVVLNETCNEFPLM